MDMRYNDENSQLPIASEATPLVVRLAQAEMDQAVTTAKAYPRSIQKAMTNILSLATLDDITAQECIYALPRGGKPIKGPSVRLAEIIASQWGNCHVGSRVVAVDRQEKVVIAEGVFHDLETGMKRVAQIHRRISDKHGKLFNDDMIAVTGNAASSIALREAILKGVPKAVWRRAYDAAENVINGDIKTLTQRRDEVIKAFAVWGVVPEQIFACIEVVGMDDVGLEEIGTLRAIYASIKDKESTVEDYFPAVTGKDRAAEAARGTAKKIAEADQAEAEKRSRADIQKEFRQKQAAKPAPKAAEVQQSNITAPVEATTNTVEADAPTTSAPPVLRREDSQVTTAEVDQAEDDGTVAVIEDDEQAEVAEINLMDFPTAKTIIEDAMDMGAEAANQAHAKLLNIIQEQQPAIYAALIAELERIGG